MICDWCGAEMHRIGAVETGLWRGHASVWLCERPECAHEREEWDSALSLVYWRWELIGALRVREWVRRVLG